MRNVKGVSHTAKWLLGVVMTFGVSAAAMAGIASTKHNLGTLGTGTVHLSAGTNEVCVFCHTPHAANTSVAAPLWNKATTLGVGGAFTTYSTATSATMDGEVLATGSVSLACLACHDGAQAMDNMINAPGSGGYNVAGARPAGYTWQGANQTGGALTGLANLGKDLSNDHPIGVRYCGGGQAASTAAGPCTDPDFFAPTNATINGTLVWWVDSTAGGTRTKTDMILYNRTFATAPAGVGPSVECASCHDPHSSNATFLRVQNTNSAVCLACHNK